MGYILKKHIFDKKIRYGRITFQCIERVVCKRAS